MSVGLEPLPEAALARFVGPPLLGTYDQLLPLQGADPALGRSAIEGYRAAYPTIAVEVTQVFDGIPAALDALRSIDVRLCVVTSKPRVVAVPILEHLGLLDRFEEVFGPGLDALTEPKCVGLERALELVGRGPGAARSDTVMIGDTRFDIEAGQACGTRTLGIAWGTDGADALRVAGADAVVIDASELRDVVVTHARWPS